LTKICHAERLHQVAVEVKCAIVIHAQHPIAEAWSFRRHPVSPSSLQVGVSITFFCDIIYLCLFYSDQCTLIICLCMYVVWCYTNPGFKINVYTFLTYLSVYRTFIQSTKNWVIILFYVKPNCLGEI